MKLWCFEDAHDWGSKLAQVAASRGHDAHLFDDPRKPDFGHLFMHMHHHPSVRILHKRVMAIAATNPELVLIPDYQSSVFYDDKLEQARLFAKWMPRTHLFYTPGAARRALEAGTITIPFMSKGSEGASSHNVRMVSTLDDARLEIRHAYSDVGIKCRHGQTQRGYLLWQSFVADNDYDVRVVAVGTKRLIHKRANKSTNGNGEVAPVVKLTPDIELALTAANNFFDATNIKWGCVDLIYDRTLCRWLMLEVSVAWTMHGYYESRFFDVQGNAQDQMGNQVWDVLVTELENGVWG